MSANSSYLYSNISEKNCACIRGVQIKNSHSNLHRMHTCVRLCRQTTVGSRYTIENSIYANKIKPNDSRSNIICIARRKEDDSNQEIEHQSASISWQVLKKFLGEAPLTKRLADLL